MENLHYCPFNNINLTDPFFDSLKADYQEFSAWFTRKALANEWAYVLVSPFNQIEGFMYLKVEEGIVTDVSPPLPAAKHLKVGTFKFNSQGTRKGERFIKKIFDHALATNIYDIYVTVFDKHSYLMQLFQQYGFQIWGSKSTPNGIENVLVKNMFVDHKHILLNYPKINTSQANKYILSIQPQFHTKMLPDSILNNESHNIIQDVSHTNSIHKIYICSMNDVTHFKPGDILLIYRTTDRTGQARFRSVLTSVCVVEEYANVHSFPTLNEFLRYTDKYSVFDTAELTRIYNAKRYQHIIKFTYNAAMQRRVIRDKLINDVGLSEDAYWGVMRVSDEQFREILRLGNINESIIIN